MLVHSVYFWLIDGTEAAAADRIADDCKRLLAKIPTVRHLWTGKPAGTPREIVDNSYQLALTVVLDDKPGLAVYADHPLHLEFIKLHKPLWKRVQVYDAI